MQSCDISLCRFIFRIWSQSLCRSDQGNGAAKLRSCKYTMHLTNHESVSSVNPAISCVMHQKMKNYQCYITTLNYRNHLWKHLCDMYFEYLVWSMAHPLTWSKQGLGPLLQHLLQQDTSWRSRHCFFGGGSSHIVHFYEPPRIHC